MPADLIRLHANPPRSRPIVQCGLTALAALAGLAGPAAAQEWHWNSGSGDWTDAGRWIPFSVPLPTATVFIGTTAAAENSTVTLDTTTSIASLIITDGMRLDTEFWYLEVAGDTVVSGQNHVSPVIYSSTLRLGPRDGASFSTRDLDLINGGRLTMDSGIGRINRTLSVADGSSIYGHGNLGFSGSGATLRNNGIIQAGTSNSLVFQQFADGRYDLDGATGDGRVHLATYSVVHDRGTRMRFDGDGLSDAFSSEISMASDSDLFMNLSDGWSVDSLGTIRMVGMPGASAKPGRIRGGELTFSGLMRVTGNPGSAGQLHVESSGFTLTPQARVELVAETRLEAGGAATTGVIVEGGTYDVGESAVLSFEAPTQMRGGTFSTTSPFPGGGRVAFNAPTAWDGPVTLNGYAIQSGDASVAGPTSITAGRFVMTGSPLTTWTINQPLTITADSIGTTGGNGVTGDLNISGGLIGRLTVNLTDPDDYWVIIGRAAINGDGILHTTRIAGSEFHLVGELAVTGGRAQISSDAWFLGGTVDIGPASASLRMTGNTRVSSLAEFTGLGTFRNAAIGHLTLAHGAELNQVGLTNEGLLDIVVSDPGVASADRLLCTDAATWAVDIGGFIAGAEHDQLLITGGTATLAGILEVRLIDAGAGLFLPQVGDEFKILSARGAVAGSFIADPVTHLDGRSYEWAVVYDTHSVTLRLENIVPAPGTLALAGIALAYASRRRRA